MKDINLIVDRKDKKNPKIELSFSQKRWNKIVNFIEELTEEERKEAMKIIDNYERGK